MSRSALHLKNRVPFEEHFSAVSALSAPGLNTVCLSFGCPNISGCRGSGHVTFSVLDGPCSRRCGYCGGFGGKFDLDVAIEHTIREKKVSVVLTSVCRDDLPDSGFALFLYALRRFLFLGNVSVDALLPDFTRPDGAKPDLDKLLLPGLSAAGHNLETVRRLHQKLRPGADYDRSLGILSEMRRLRPGLRVRSALLAGLGETQAELAETIAEIRDAGAGEIVIGQYLCPPGSGLEVRHYYSLREFADLAGTAQKLGFARISVFPLARYSSV